MSNTVRRNAVFTSRTFGLIALACAGVSMCGCMKMETQRTTLEHRPNVVRPEGSDGGEAKVATVPENGPREGGDSFR